MRPELTHVFRQEDARFVSILNQLRHGIVSSEGLELLNSVARPLAIQNGVLPTVLYCTNASVDAKNLAELRKLPDPQVCGAAVLIARMVWWC
jgi:ATP-dependent DNA helicase PIF1